MRASFKAMLRSPVMMLALLFLILLASSAALATTLTLSNNVYAGGTGLVTVSCPAGTAANPCTVTSVTWTLDTNPPFYVKGASVTWTPSFSGNAQVCVNVYTGASTTPTAGACASASNLTSGSSITTTVNFSTPYPYVNPKDIDKVEVIIVQT